MNITEAKDRVKDHGTVTSGTITPNVAEAHTHYITCGGNMNIANPEGFALDEVVHLRIVLINPNLHSITLGNEYDIEGVNNTDSKYSVGTNGFGKGKNIIHLISSGRSTQFSKCWIEADKLYEWERIATLDRPADFDSTDQYGYPEAACISGGGNVIIVGAYQWDGTSADQGCVYVYRKYGDEWKYEATLSKSGTPGAVHVGTRCAISHNGAVIYATGYTSTVPDIVVRWTYAGGSTWTESYSMNIPGGLYCSSVSTNYDGSKVVFGDENNGTSSYGRVYTYDWNGSALVEDTSAFLEYGDTDGTDTTSPKFGENVYLSGNGLVLVVTASGDTSTLDGDGLSYTFDWNAGTGTWDQRGTGGFIPSPVDGDQSGWGDLASGSSMNYTGTMYISNVGTTNEVAYLCEYNGSSWVATAAIGASGGTSLAICSMSEDAEYLLQANDSEDLIHVLKRKEQ